MPTFANIRLSRQNILFYPNNMGELAQPLNINVIHNIHVIGEFKVVANLHWTENHSYNISLLYVYGYSIGAYI